MMPTNINPESVADVCLFSIVFVVLFLVALYHCSQLALAPGALPLFTVQDRPLQRWGKCVKQNTLGVWRYSIFGYWSNGWYMAVGTHAGLHLGGRWGWGGGGGGKAKPLLARILPPSLGTCEHCMRCENKTSDAPPTLFVNFRSLLTIFLNKPLLMNNDVHVGWYIGIK